MTSEQVGTIAAGFISNLGTILVDNLPAILLFVAGVLGLMVALRLVKGALRSIK